MDLPCIQWQEHVSQKWTGLDPELREHFSSLLEIDDLFKFTLTLTTHDDLDFLQSLSAEFPIHKDEEEAARQREGGNLSFKRKEYTAAALQYSQGVCSAPQTSEQLSLCFANRSAALCHLRRYQESLDDIDAALKSGYPPHLVYKLKERRSLCQEQISKGLKVKEGHHRAAAENHIYPQRATESSAGAPTPGIYPSAAVHFNAGKGRHLVAAERITPGEVLLNDRPYSCVLIPGMEEVKGAALRWENQRGEFGPEHRRCHRCLLEMLNPIPCEGCSFSRYCSTSCQRDAWEEHHCWECPIGAHLRVMGVMSQLALRVTLKAGLQNIQMAREVSASCQSEPPDPCRSHQGDSYLSVFHLLHHLDHHSVSLRFLYALTAATLTLKLTKIEAQSASRHQSRPPNSHSAPLEETEWSSESWLMGSAVLRHILQLRCNAQEQKSLQCSGAGKSAYSAIFPTLSLLNHSCSPNTSLAFSTGTRWDSSKTEVSKGSSGNEARNKNVSCGVTATVRAAKVIPAGKEILHCYGPHSSRMVTRERQRLLQDQYFFFCQCEACVKEEEEEDEAGKKDKEPRADSQESGVLCSTCRGSLRRCTEDKRKSFICSRPSCGHRISWPEVSLRLQELRVDLEAAVEILERDQPDEALRLLKRTQGQSGQILAETHPLQGELADATARAYATMGDWKNAASHLERSTAAISSQYGEDSIELARQLFKLAQLHFNGGARVQAMSLIPKVRRLLCLHLGPRCPELEELQAMEDCLRD